MVKILWLPLSLASLLLSLPGCASRPSASQDSPPLEWRLVPGTTVMGERRQFFVYGENLDSALVTASMGVLIEKGWVKEDGKVLSLYLTVSEPVAADSTLLGEKPGIRKVRVGNTDTAVTFRLRIMDER